MTIPTLTARASLAALASLLLAAAPSARADLGSAARDPSPALLLVLEKSADSIAFLDAGTGETLHRLDTGAGPHEVAVSPEGIAVVANYGRGTPGSTLSVYDVRTPELLHVVDLGEYGRPHGIEFDEQGLFCYVTAEADRAVLRVRVGREEGRVVDAFDTDQDGSHMLALAPDESRVYTANIAAGSVSAIDLESGELLAVIPTGDGAEGIALTPDGGELWVSNRASDTLSVIDTEKLAVDDEIECGSFPIRIEITHDGSYALVTNARSGDVAVFDVETREEVHRVAMERGIAEDAEEGLFGDAFGPSPVPIGVLADPRGDRAWVANASADAVAVVDLGSFAVTDWLPTGSEPDGLAFVPAGITGLDAGVRPAGTGPESEE